MASMHTPPRTSTGKLGLVAGATVLAALVVFLAGRYTGDASASRREGPIALAGGAEQDQPGWASEPSRLALPRRAGPAATSQASQPSQPSSPSFASAGAPSDLPPLGQSTAAVQAATQKAAIETRTQLEASKRDLVDKCWPAKGLPGGRTRTRVTFSVAYDAYGREVGRGISEDRRSPTGDLRKCLARLPMGTLRVSPPGSSVGVNVALNLP